MSADEQKTPVNMPELPEDAVLFVDDEQNILSSIRRVIRPIGVKAFFANSGAEGLNILAENDISLVVSDMRMPEMDGAQFLAQVKERWPETVRILLTGFSDISSTIDALNKGGIYRYISKPWNDVELQQIVQESMRLKRAERERDALVEVTRKQNAELQDLNANLEKKVEARTEEIRQANDMLDLAYQELNESYDSFIRVFSTMLSNREALKKGQAQLVADFSKRIAEALKLKEEEVRDIYYAGLLHQLGKTSLPDELLAVPESLMNANERKQYEQYPALGAAALTAITGLEKTAKIIRSHMETNDGKGYPEGKEGNKIRPGARIIRAVRDYIGLQTGMVHKESMTAAQAIAYIKSEAGKKYDRIVAKALVHFSSEYDLKDMYSNEIKLETHCLRSGMRLTRDLCNAQGILLIAKDHVLNEKVIEKIMLLEKIEHHKFVVFVAEEHETAEQFVAE